MDSWTVSDGLDTYHVPAWGAGYFTANEEGHVLAQPRRGNHASIDLKVLVDDLRRRGYELPLLLRFSDILHSRVEELVGCMRRAIDEYEYTGENRYVYPIKVNQQRHVVEELLKWGQPFHLGLEVGSKPEMLIALAIMADPHALIVCNGYKDEEYVETALLAQKLGRNPILVIDRFRELPLILRKAKELGVKPVIGVRAKLQARGAGRWAESAGSSSKFGLTTSELMEAIGVLKEARMLDSLQLLHFHLGSQIPNIRVITEALREASRVFVELHALGANMRYFDVGGGLGVDYDGSKTNFHSSMNYTVQEYANDVVSSIGEACKERGIPHPTILSESGRALVAHHAVLVFNVLDINERIEREEPEEPTDEDHRVVHDLYETWASIGHRNLHEPYHDALQFRDEANQHFLLGYLDLGGRARAERLFFACCTRIHRLLRDLPRMPEDLEGLERALADTYFCNFSVFQSMPDSWAVNQLFPVMPIHRLNEPPTRSATLADLTCDSDGKVDSFIDLHDVKRVLPLHAPDGEPYYVGVFLVGAYQEILGDLHNLFGDTNAIHVALEGDRYRVTHVVEGDTTAEVLGYVEFDRRDLVQRVRAACEEALWQEQISPEETRLLIQRYESGLNGYTYLADEHGAPPTPKKKAKTRVGKGEAEDVGRRGNGKSAPRVRRSPE